MSAAERPRETTAAPLPRAPIAPLEPDQLRVRLMWLLVFRAVVVTVLLVTALVLRATAAESLFERAAGVLYGVASVSYVTILAGAIWMRLWPNRGIRELAYLQLAFDAFVAAVVVVLTGGVESVFVFVFSLTVLNAAAVLQKRGARTLAATVAALYATILLLETTGVIIPLGLDRPPRVSDVLPPFLTNTASFALVAGLAGYLTEQVKKAGEKLDVARATIERLELLYGAVLESLPSGVLTVDETGRVVYVNGAGADILGDEVALLIGERLEDRVPALAQTGHEGERFERTALAGKKGERTIGGSTAALTGLEGLAGRVIVYQDLTELRRLQGDVARAERLAELGRFAAGLAHEIRNPLAAMIGCLQLLRADDPNKRGLGEEGERMLNIVHREAERLSSLVSEFLTYARPADPHLLPTELRPLVDETVAAAAQGASDVDMTVEGDNVSALCDSDQLRQVLWNLVGNAAQAVRTDESRRGRVRVLLSHESGWVAVHVDDDGPGVADEIRARIFEPFFTTRPDGTGLGLATSHQMISRVGGSLTVNASPLGGARFSVRLRPAPVA